MNLLRSVIGAAPHELIASGGHVTAENSRHTGAWAGRVVYGPGKK